MNQGKLIRTTILLLTSFLLLTGVGFSQEQVLKSRDISGGVNEFDRESLIKDNESTVLKNATIREGGVARKREGMTDISNNTTASTVIALSHYYKNGDASKRLCMVYANSLDVFDGSSWTEGVMTDLTSAGNLEMFTAGDYLWFISPSINPRAYDFTNLTISGGTSVEAPAAWGGLYHQGRVILYSKPGYLDYFYWSELGPEIAKLMTFSQTTNAHKVDSGDNQALVAMIDYGMTGNEGMVAFKDASTFYVDTSQADPADWSIVKLFNHGCVAQRTVQKVGNDIYFLSRDGETYKVRTVSRTQYDTINVGNIPLSNNVQNLLSDVANGYINKACSYFYDDYYILSFPSSSSTYNDVTVVYDTQKSAWVEYTGWYPSQFTTYIDSNVERLYFGDDRAFANTYMAWEGTDDDGTAINYQEESKQHDFSAPEVTKNWKNIEFEFSGVSTHQYADVYIKLDEGGWTQLKDSNGDRLDLYVATPTLPIHLPFFLVEPGIIRQTYDISQLGRGRGLKWKIQQNETGVSSDFERLGVYLRGWANKQEWEGEK